MFTQGKGSTPTGLVFVWDTNMDEITSRERYIGPAVFVDNLKIVFYWSVTGDAVNRLALFRIEEIHTFRFKWNRKRHWNGFHPGKLAGFASHHRRAISVPVHWTPKFFLFPHDTNERPRICCAKGEHRITFRSLWLIGCWTVYSEWVM